METFKYFCSKIYFLLLILLSQMLRNKNESGTKTQTNKHKMEYLFE